MTIDLAHNSGLAPGHAEPVLGKAALADRINDAIDAGLQKRRSQEPRRPYLGGSRLGEECGRMLALEYRAEIEDGPQAAAEPWSGLMLRVFDAGHAFEALTIAWLRQAGFVIRDKLPNGQQFRFSQADGRIAGGIDGVVVDGPLGLLPYPVLFENKALGSTYWSKLRKIGLRRYSSENMFGATYYPQVQLYMGYFNLKHCLFGSMNKNTQELYWELVEFSPAVAQRLSDRAVDILRVLDAGELPPRIADDPSHFKCKSCRMREACWK